MSESRLMPGLTIRSLKKHPSLIPLLTFLGIGAGMAAFYVARLATRSPDVCWDKKNNPYPWQKKDVNFQYKFYSDKMDYKKLQSPAGRPDI